MKIFISTLLFISLTTIIYGQEDKVYKNLDEALKNVKEVYQLDLSGQNLKELPKGFKKMKNLRKLNLSKNSFKNLPGFGDFYDLEEADLSNNNLESIPSFIKLNGEVKNLIIDNNPVVKITPSTKSAQELTEENFEGTMNLGSDGSHEIWQGNKDVFLRVYPDSKKKYWMEIHAKNEMTNENLIKNILNKKNEHFNYFINKHSTFDSKQDNTPAYVMYSYSNTSGKVWISSNNFLVVFDKYYITLNTTEKYITLYDVKKLLSIAITYQPKNNGLSSDLFSKLESITATSFLAAAQAPSFEKINSSIVDPKITKEIIYTMKAGETVAFTNEYQLGIELKEAEYYIYIKKGGKYYLHTAEKIFGPYDDLNSANPNNPNSDNLIKGFNVTKGQQKYIISEGEEIGPFSKDSYFSTYKDITSITEKVDKEYYITIEGKKMGPFVSWPSYAKTNEGIITYGRNSDKKYILYINGELKDKGIDRTGWSFEQDGYLAYDFIKDGKLFVYFNNQNYGPFDEIRNIQVEKGAITFYYKNEGKSYVFINGKKEGPYDFIGTSSYVSILDAFYYKINGEYFAQIVGGKKYGPYPSVPSIFFDSESKKYLVAGGKKGNIELIYNGEKLGVFNNYMKSYGSKQNEMFNSDKLPNLIVENKDNTFTMFVQDKIYGPFKGEPSYIYDSITKQEAIVYTESNNGRDEVYLIKDGNKIGPFKSAVFNTVLSRGSAKFYDNYLFALEDFNNKFYLFTTKQTFGPLDACSFKHEYRPKNVSTICTINGETYFFNNDKFYGPAKEPKVTGEKQYPSLGFFGGEEGGVYVGSNYMNKEEPCVINNLPFKENYNLIGFNNTNYVADTYWTADRRFVLNNKLYSNGVLNYSYDQENKVFYWLTIEGKNIIRNKVKF